MKRTNKKNLKKMCPQNHPFTTRLLTANDLPLFQELICLFEDVFEMKDFKMPHPEYLQELLSRPGFYVFVILAANKVVGGLTAHTLASYYFESSEIYLYDLAVKAEFQRKGLGRKLLTALQDYSREQGMKEIFVQADLEDQHAIDFYRSTGGTPEKVVHFSYPLTNHK